jgi:hypothetical protein
MTPSSLWVDWRLGFMAAHPALFRIKTVKPQLSSGYPLCQVGWQDLLERLCGSIEGALRADESFEFERIGQKLGVLCVSWDGELSEETTIRVKRAVDLAVARSASTCEICGAGGRLHTHRRWLSTGCTDHALGSAVPVQAVLGNVQLCHRPPSKRDVPRPLRPRRRQPDRPPVRASRIGDLAMARFRCGACFEEGEFEYDWTQTVSPLHGSSDAVIVLAISEPDDGLDEALLSVSRLNGHDTSEV